MMIEFKTVAEWADIRKKTDKSKTIGLVPTMGALHKGHQSLVEKSLSENDCTVVSLFVNPTQFNDKEDLKKYPRNDERDLKLLQDLNVDYVFSPHYQELYPDEFTYKVIETTFSKQLCGASRPGHFDGVLTVVMKLLNIIKPDRCYFGEKDHQQFTLIHSMCKAFFLTSEIVMCPTVRDPDGLALSSRNQLLSEADRKIAAKFPELLKSTGTADEIKAKLEHAGLKADFVEDIGNRRYGAVYVGGVRLIDNVKIN